MARERRKAKETEFDMTPMIDCTFQLIIFFILTSKFKQVERRQGADLPLDEGPNPTPATAVSKLTLRMVWKDQTMSYWVDVQQGVGEQSGKGKQIPAGGLAALMADRTKMGVPHYSEVHKQLVDAIRSAHVRALGSGKVDKVEVSMSANTAESSLKHIGETAPWGFVTLAVDACTEYNKTLSPDKRLSISFKNTEPASGASVAKKGS
jgi:hypothetical protein